MDGISAFALAANILQFIEFGQKLTSKSKEIYNSASGQTVTQAEIDLIYVDLSTITGRLAVRIPSPDRADEQMNRMASACWSVAQELLGITKDLKDQHNLRRHKRWASIRAAFNDIGKSSRLAELRDRLRAFREELTFHLVVLLGDQQSSITEEIRKISDENSRKELTGQLVTLLGDRQSSILQEVRKLADENKRMDLAQYERLDNLTDSLGRIQNSIDDRIQFAIRDQLEIPTVDGSTEPFPPPEVLSQAELFSRPELVSQARTQLELTDLTPAIESVARDINVLAKEQRLLTSLRYPFMESRFDNVATAYNQTFEWIYETNCDAGFVQWLQHDDGLFWITGKPGSGKSTLMKYLYNHPETHARLETWADGSNLVTASFFFWSIGTQIQKSQVGLLRSLIFSILRQCPHIMHSSGVCTSFWSSEKNHPLVEEFWTLEKLKLTIREILQQEEAHTKFCFFIDGLDEYVGRHSDLVRILDSLLNSGFIKICASSRPWNVFQDAYGRYRNIYLENLTRGDIEVYVRAGLDNHAQLALESLQSGELNELVETIVDRAQGVFLWVYLVMMSLDEGLTNGDDIALLQARLSHIPDDLETFFRLILESVDPFYKDKMAKTFQMVLQSSEPLSLITLSFLDEKISDESIRMICEEELSRRRAQTRRRINGRYKGLLEINRSGVDFFHRTVHDFVRLNQIQQLFQQHLPRNFNANAAICRVLLMSIKRTVFFSSGDDAEDVLRKFMKHARLLELETNTAPFQLLEEMEETMVDLRDQFSIKFEREFLDYAIREGLQLYVCQKLLDGSRREQKKLDQFLWKLLGTLSVTSQDRSGYTNVPDVLKALLTRTANRSYRLDTSYILGQFLKDFMNPAKYSAKELYTHTSLVGQQSRVLSILLEHGADPNALEWGTSTTWEGFLGVVYSRGRRWSMVHQKSFLAIAKAFIAHGADLDACPRMITAGNNVTMENLTPKRFLEPESLDGTSITAATWTSTHIGPSRRGYIFKILSKVSGCIGFLLLLLAKILLLPFFALGHDIFVLIEAWRRPRRIPYVDSSSDEESSQYDPYHDEDLPPRPSGFWV